jgi:hypothetical protein
MPHSWHFPTGIMLEQQVEGSSHEDHVSHWTPDDFDARRGSIQRGLKRLVS